jgi:hypothetical protein
MKELPDLKQQIWSSLGSIETGYMDRKQTAWKKSRKFGDVYGGRGSPKICDRISNRAHSISPPSQLDRLPIYIVDNPARDFLFPLQPDEIARELQQLPARNHSQITHIWLRRFNKRTYSHPIEPKYPLSRWVQLLIK